MLQMQKVIYMKHSPCAEQNTTKIPAKLVPGVSRKHPGGNSPMTVENGREKKYYQSFVITIRNEPCQVSTS